MLTMKTRFIHPTKLTSRSLLNQKKTDHNNDNAAIDLMF